MSNRPAGTLTFLFTDIEGSTRRWESDRDAMQSALTAHDRVLRCAIESHGGTLFKHTGDGVCAAFDSARAAIDAAVDAQRGLELPVRMGMATGEVDARNDDYFGPALNRAARVMAAGHGGQILVAESTMQLVTGVACVDLGKHLLRDISEAIRLFQVCAEGLEVAFPPLKTVDRSRGNLPVPVTSFVGRESDVSLLVELVKSHPLVTLTGVGGVGKTRLAGEVGAQLAGEFRDGVWLVELAPVRDVVGVPDAVANVLGITPKPGYTVIESVVAGLAGRQLLIVLDNCEHVLDAAADVVDAVLLGTETVKVVATSREGLRLRGERLWAVSALDVESGVTSAAVELFVQRARAVVPAFSLDHDAKAVMEICRRLDGIALAIELAAARMVSMSPADVRDRLDNRFRLLSDPRRGGLDHHKTLHQAVQWSYDLLEIAERTMLNRCSVFSDGFDLAAAVHLSDDPDEFVVLDLLDSLVRKSLVTIEHASSHARYGMLETIREFAHDELAASDTVEQVRDRHASYFADQAVAHWSEWDGPHQKSALEWVDLELANLRAGFRWAVARGDLVCAADIAAHSSILAFVLQRFEPVGWAEELLEAASAADISRLPRLYTAASICAYTGRPQQAVWYAEIALALEADESHDAFDSCWSLLLAAVGYRYTGRIDRSFDICTALAEQTGLAHVIGSCGLLYLMAVDGRTPEAQAIADETLAAARAHQSPFWIAWALEGYGRAHSETDPALALAMFRECLDYSRANRLLYWAAIVTREGAMLESVHGELRHALLLFDIAIDSFHRASNMAHLAASFAALAGFFSRVGELEIAATFYWMTIPHADMSAFVALPSVVDRLVSLLGAGVFDKCVAEGSAMDPNSAMAYARGQIQLARGLLPDPG